MRASDLKVLDQMTLPDLEAALDAHTRRQLPLDRFTLFSWSVSRHLTLTACPRRYYLQYYGTRRVRDRDNPPAISAIWWLKQVKPLRTWVGQVIHRAAALAVRAHKEGGQIEAERLIEDALKDYRGGVTASGRGAKHDGQWLVLHEHVYPDDAFSIDRDQAEQQVVDLTQALLESPAYERITDLPPEGVIEIDRPFQMVEFDGVPLFAIPDVLLKDGDSFEVIDWKTGDVTRPGIREQAGVYRLYVHLRYRALENQIGVSIADLAGGSLIAPPGGLPTLAEAAEFVRESMAYMSDLMDRVEFNTASIVNFPLTDDLGECRGCGFKRACWRHDLIYD
jgi:hypothetical protein